MANAQVTLTQGPLTLSVLLGDASPVLSDGVSTWETDARPKRKSITRYTGRLPFKQDIAVMFDGFQDHESQEARISMLERMAGAPRVIQLSGIALRQDLDWIITGVDWDTTNTIWYRGTDANVRVRQAATIHFLEFVKDDVIQTPTVLHIAKKSKDPQKKVTVKSGMYIKQIAAEELGDADKWMMLVRANPKVLNDNPRQFVKSGTILVIPSSAWDVLHGINPIFMVP